MTNPAFVNEKSSLSPKRAALELSLAGALWGFGFIAAIWALRAFTPLSITFIRFTIAALVGLPFCFLSPALRKATTWSQLRLAIIPGVLISLTLVFQTWGLRMTTATKSGFITTLYILIVPLMERVFLRKRLPRFHWLYVFTALIGVGLICGISGNQTTWNWGDLLTLVCSILASAHIVWIGMIQDRVRSPFAFNLLQCVWAALVPIPFLLFDHHAIALTAPLVSWAGIASLAIGSTLIGFALQVRAQKVISASTASLLFLLESPFAACFALWILGEKQRADQWLGAGLILMAAFLSVVFNRETSA